MNHYDVLLIHPSARMSSPEFVLMPVGMIALMNELRNYNVQAVNVGLELGLNPYFDLEKYVKTIDFEVVGIDLHWHPHTYAALKIAELCKSIHPDCCIVMGGMTASYFAEEILQFSPHVDVVVRGEAEEIMPALVESRDFSSIPNLVYKDTTIKKTPSAPPPCLDTFDFSTIKNLLHWEEYLGCTASKPLKAPFWYSFWLCTGRGCIYNCSYCGGAKSAQKHILGRDTLTFRSVDNIVQDLLYLQQLGVHVVKFTQDIVLGGKKYWEPLFKSMKKEGISMGLYLEVWQIPNKEFIEAMASVWDTHFSTVVITLLSGSETVRRKNGKVFSTNDYFKCIQQLETHSINHVPYFATGLPFETVKTFESTLTLTKTLLSECNPYTLFCTSLALDPGSPMYEHPHQYAIVKHLHTFTDYYNRSERKAKNLPYDITGYHTAFLTGEQIITLQKKWETLYRDLAAAPDNIHFL